MNDRELLELAAKAAGIECEEMPLMGGPAPYAAGMKFLGLKLTCGKCWNSLTDNGDAFQLAVKLKIDIMFFDGFEEIHADYNDYIKGAVIEAYSDDMQASVRRAITRAAAEIELAWGGSE